MSQVHENYVRMGHHVCPACGTKHESGEILLHRRLQEIPEDKTITGWGTCPKCTEMADKGYIVLVEIDPKLTSRDAGIATSFRPSDVYRTGRIAYLRKSVVSQVIKGWDESKPFAWIDPEVFALLEKMAPPSGGTDEHV